MTNVGLVTPLLLFREYETLVADLCRRLAGDRALTVQHNQNLLGRSGQSHQIDVTVEFIELDTRFLVLIECKFWSRPVTVEEVLVLAERVTDVAAQKGIIVAKSGFQSGAITFARARGIALFQYSGGPDARFGAVAAAAPSGLSWWQVALVGAAVVVVAGVETIKGWFVGGNTDNAKPSDDTAPKDFSPFVYSFIAGEGSIEPITTPLGSFVRQIVRQPHQNP